MLMFLCLAATRLSLSLCAPQTLNDPAIVFGYLFYSRGRHVFEQHTVEHRALRRPYVHFNCPYNYASPLVHQSARTAFAIVFWQMAERSHFI